MIIEMIKEAFRSLFGNKMRSFLSMLGIIIGVMAVIVVLSLGNGATYSVKKDIESIGSNIIIAYAYSPKEKITIKELETFKKNSQYISEITPNISSFAEASYRKNKFPGQTFGTTNDFIKLYKLEILQGRLINDADNKARLMVAMIGENIAQKLFKHEFPIGKYIKLKIKDRVIKLKVVGVLKKKDINMFLNVANSIFIPYTTLIERILKTNAINEFFAKAKNGAVIEQAKAEIQFFLKNKIKDKKYFEIYSQTEMLGTVNEITNMLNLVFGIVAGISLLVGGIGIMNIMLVSVTERTREIGIKKAIGATNANILMQFLTESIFLTTVAGIIGLIIGLYVSKGIGILIKITPFFDINQIIMTVLISMSIGLFFGVSPAVKASKLNPVDSLRYE
ncbi:macrolide ABC transporter ATP-binding protein [Marinitoga sp. 1135]|uniref:ABC-type transport system, involved in lipoprotein release, permease component n=1 Tax=Marinitoga piezophila (strain DSM 14283 / JCM 11233 / KA3) TaxID=443254 RepID=H2J3H2_MARPK|nr:MULTISPECIES: ABC transporter permease [Marinitoga]AEX85788.1 ABC-type transport system, involved in lipoprotein release, permease component [Marinitoga piezophila KA3]APT76230.1 macrolide ABC transporter ATP-binding protein [Marinitoga sp. 1137]NUU95989.1 macrolide ABC transporter ATP-binding protein [Marinitoga sp. 1135]NUU97901.1 macrolide ABC transporter ATP-binding protein [Marinitoga sp. 1138]